jgi:hypothetical protein
MAIDLSFLDSDTMLSVIFAFLAGSSFVMIYSKIKTIFKESRYRVDDTIVEAVVLEYTRRLQDYDKAIAELRMRFDIMDARTHPSITTSQNTSQPQSYVAHEAQAVAVTQHVTMGKEGNGTTDYILKLLSERSRTSREVQVAIGRTREHTARLMKKLYESGAVSRDINTKPFRYSITDAGREMLMRRAEAAPVAA